MPPPPPPPPNSGANPTARRLLGYSADRTIVRGEQGKLLKIYETGGLDQARAEVRAGQLLAGPGVVGYGRAARDPISGRPLVEINEVSGIDLDRMVTEHGPSRPGEVARLGGEVAEILTRLASSGLVHRDIKPSNVVVREDGSTVLIDCEHAVQVGMPTGGAPFTGATHGFAPPEAYTGQAPTPAFDIFGLGATMHVLVTGYKPFERRMPDCGIRPGPGPALSTIPTALFDLIGACLDPNPIARPSASELSRALALFRSEHEASPDDAALDRALEALTEGRFSVAEELASGVAGPRADRVQNSITRLRRLAARVGPPPDLPEAPRDASGLAARVVERAPRLLSFLRRFPRHPGAVAAKTRMADAISRLLTEAGPSVDTMRRAAQFDDALALLHNIRQAVLEFGWEQHRAPSSPLSMPPPVWRKPTEILTQLSEEVSENHERHVEVMSRLKAAEADLDLDRAAHVLDELAAMYGGASNVVGSLKDRIHSFGFYLARLGSLVADEVIDLARHAGTLAPSDRDALRSFVTRCADAAPAAIAAELTGPPISPRGARRSARDLLQRFPHVRPALGPGITALENLLCNLTRHAWRQLDDVEQKLATPPIPIRVVRELLEHLDELRSAEVITEVPDRTASLADVMEHQRDRFDQARAARNQIARGARDALDRGHITTALFDMSRAVDRFDAEADEPQSEAEHLNQQLEETRRRKLEVERQIRVNQALAVRYAELVDSTESDSGALVEALEERLRTLAFLGEALGGERGEAYRGDHSDVLAVLLQEHGSEGEHQMAQLGVDRLAERAETARSTRQRIHDTLHRHDIAPGERSGRVHRLLDHWQQLETSCVRDLQAAQRRATRRRTRWMVAIGTAVVLAGGAAAAWWAFR